MNDKFPGRLQNRFWSKVQKTDGCWNWAASTTVSGGYGQISIGGRSGGPQRAHRISYELLVGKIPAGLHVLHHCDNPRCVNPEHLFLGTDQDNSDDKIAKGRAGINPQSRKTHCSQGHEYNAENTYLYHGERQCRMCHRDEARKKLNIQPDRWRK